MREYTKETWNLAYGANMSPRALKRRRLTPLESVPACLPGWSLEFTVRGVPVLEPSFASVAPCDTPGAELHGVLHRLTPEDIVKLIRSEGGGGHPGYGYQMQTVVAKAYDGREIECEVLVVHEASRCESGFLPSRRYMKLLVEGAKHFKVCPDYVSYLESLPWHRNRRFTRVLCLLVLGVLALFFIVPLLPLYPVIGLTVLHPSYRVMKQVCWFLLEWLHLCDGGDQRRCGSLCYTKKTR